MDTKAKILDIAMNLNRIGNWAADDFDGKEKRIRMFLDQTNGYIESVPKSSLREPFKKTFDRFLEEYDVLKHEGEKKPTDTLAWAERLMTWGNILTHRTQLLKS